MSPESFAQILLTEHLLIISGQGYRPIDHLLDEIEKMENRRRVCLSLPYPSFVKYHERLTALGIWKGLTNIPSATTSTFSEQASIRLAEELKVDFVVLGDQVSRNTLHESDEGISAKTKGLLKANIVPVVCFGESLGDYLRGASVEVIQDQLSSLLLGLTFDQILKVVLVYKAPWVNYIPPETFGEESKKTHQLVLEAMESLLGHEAASHIPLFTDLPFVLEDFSKLTADTPPSGYFLDLEGKKTGIVTAYNTILTQFPSKTPRTKPVIENFPLEKGEEKPSLKDEETEHEEEESVIEESLHETILAVDTEMENSTMEFEIHESTQIPFEERAAKSGDEDFQMDWYSDEELESLRKEFGIPPDGSQASRYFPAWDSSRSVRIIKTKQQKLQDA